MPFKKLDELVAWWRDEIRCKHPEHEPPTMIVLEPGCYEWTCPACGAVRTVRVPPRTGWRGCQHEGCGERTHCGDCIDWDADLRGGDW